MKIDIGCGAVKKDGCIGIDVMPSPAVDVIVDLDKAALPFQSRSVSYVHSSHCLEHLHNPIGVLKEICRVAENSAVIEIWLPYGWSNGGQIFDHKTFFNEDHFLHLCRWYRDAWKGTLNCSLYITQFNFVIDARTLVNLHKAGVSLWFALRHYHNIAKEFCTYFQVFHDNAPPLPAISRTFSTGRFERRYPIKPDQFMPEPAYDDTDMAASALALDEAISRFAGD